MLVTLGQTILNREALEAVPKSCCQKRVTRTKRTDLTSRRPELVDLRDPLLQLHAHATVNSPILTHHFSPVWPVLRAALRTVSVRFFEWYLLLAVSYKNCVTVSV